jgi:hypothetical protein
MEEQDGLSRRTLGGSWSEKRIKEIEEKMREEILQNKAIPQQNRNISSSTFKDFEIQEKMRAQKLTEQQVECNIATLFPDTAKACYRQIAKLEREEAANLRGNPTQARGNPTQASPRQSGAGMSDVEMKKLVNDCFDAIEATTKVADEQFQCGPCGGCSWTDSSGMLNMITEESSAQLLGSVTQVRVRPAMDSGACDNVIDPDDLPDGCHIEPNVSGKHFRGANDNVIENFGDVETILESELGAIGCGWKAAAVSRPLHSVSKVAGPPGGIKNSKQDVLFNNDICVVVPPGIVAEILKRVTPVAQYAREGNLYVGDMVMSSFTRQGPQA